MFRQSSSRSGNGNVVPGLAAGSIPCNRSPIVSPCRTRMPTGTTPFHGRGRGFESRPLHVNGAVAQLAERENTFLHFRRARHGFAFRVLFSSGECRRNYTGRPARGWVRVPLPQGRAFRQLRHRPLHACLTGFAALLRVSSTIPTPQLSTLFGAWVKADHVDRHGCGNVGVLDVEANRSTITGD